jgi:Tetratricopeptide repeat
VLARRGELDEAERVGREAVAIASATDVLELRAQALADLGEVLRLARRPDESAAALNEAIALYEEKGNVVEIGRLRGLLTQPPIEV